MPGAYRDILLRAAEELRLLLGHLVQAGVQGAVCKRRGVGGGGAGAQPASSRTGPLAGPPARALEKRYRLTPAPPSRPRSNSAPPSRTAVSPAPAPPSSEGGLRLGLPPPGLASSRRAQGTAFRSPPRRQAALHAPQSSGPSKLSVKNRVGSAISLRSISSAILPPPPDHEPAPEARLSPQQLMR